MSTDWTWTGFFQSLFGLMQWGIAIISVAATLALLGWILMMFFKKDKAK
jgi:hypothetical protein